VALSGCSAIWLLLCRPACVVRPNAHPPTNPPIDSTRLRKAPAVRLQPRLAAG